MSPLKEHFAEEAKGENSGINSAVMGDMSTVTQKLV